VADPVIPAVGFIPGRRAVRTCFANHPRRKARDDHKPFELDPGCGPRGDEGGARPGCVVHLNSPAPVMPLDVGQIKAWRSPI